MTVIVRVQNGLYTNSFITTGDTRFFMSVGTPPYTKWTFLYCVHAGIWTTWLRLRQPKHRTWHSAKDVYIFIHKNCKQSTAHVAAPLVTGSIQFRAHVAD